LNGAELPCGSVLSVEPANMDYKNKNKNSHSEKPVEKKGSLTEKTVPNNTDKEDNDNDDLDDFFASLE